MTANLFPKSLNTIIEGDAEKSLSDMPDRFVDCCISSPPYFRLRDYGVDGQIGMESTVNEYIQKLKGVYQQVLRIMKDTGTCFINLGDCYDDDKSLMMIPEQFAMAMKQMGWVLRNQIIWHKPNQMPQSASDRFTVDFEKIFFFTKKTDGYYFEQQLEPYTKPLNRWAGDNLKATGKSEWSDQTKQAAYRNRNMRPNPEGKNMRTVWQINTKPFTDAHFATFPQKLVQRMIKAGCPVEVCGNCLKPFEVQYETKLLPKRSKSDNFGKRGGIRDDSGVNYQPKSKKIAGYVKVCDCQCETTDAGLVLDPFMGAGTTAVVAKKMNRHFIGIELNPKYKAIADKRLQDEIGLFWNTPGSC